MNDLAASLQQLQGDTLPGLLSLKWLHAEQGRIEGRLNVEPRHLAPNGFLQAASVVALADSACGFGAVVSLLGGASGFTTVELKANFLDTARDGSVTCEARLIHGGRTTQLWDADVRNDTTGKTIVLVPCTQILHYPSTNTSDADGADAQVIPNE